MERGLVVGAFGVLLVGLLWAANSFAGAYGTGRAEAESQVLSRRPEVVLFTEEALPSTPAGVTHADLGQGVEPRHEYRGLRLLLQSDDRLFLVPAQWTDESSTFVVPYDDKIRLRLLAPR
ncbi:hypothetical protein [Paractinoplanes maris]|uniref:hypothetical protein n=1 Tax=Paractinoplanes maris TaxID=1734446 RepID=UPI002021DCDE|nr:hypothetical protein [Actinoplanes maris]